MYCTIQQVEARVPHAIVLQALDDNRDGQIDADVQAAWETSVDGEIDGFLGQRYSVPFGSPAPSVVFSAALILRCEALYQRRGVAADANPFTNLAAAIRLKLDRIGRGVDPLTSDTPKAHAPGVIIAESSRLSPCTSDDPDADVIAPPRQLN
jgi:phage gp36-like protein